MRLVIILLCLCLSGCSWFNRVAPLDTNFDSRKEDRAKVEKVRCDCDNPDQLSFGYPEIDKREKGHISISNPDYEVMADNQQGRLKWQREGRGYKRCILRCLVEYNDYLTEFNK